MNREDRLRRELPAELKNRAGELAGLPVAQIDLIVAALRGSHRAGREHEKQARRQLRERKQRQRENAGFDTSADDAEVADATEAMVSRSLVPRAAISLEALARLDQHYKDGPAVINLAVAGARARGYSDTQIGVALGHPPEYARQAVGQRFGRRGSPADCSDDHYTRQAAGGAP